MPRRVMCIAVTVAALSLAVLSSACSQEQISEQPALVRSAEQGDAVAQAALGVSYALGEGVPEDDGEAIRWFRLAADQGNARAQYNLGLMYANGEGVPEDDGEAVRWYRLAADQGNARAQAAIGTMYANGRGVPEDDGEAVRWYRLAADQGNARAQGLLGTMYHTGRGVPEDDGEAVRWWRLAADQGHAGAQAALGTMYDGGRGVPEDDGEAVRWFRLAADQGNARAQVLLGTMHHTGRGVPEDESEAVRWYRLAADQGLAEAQYVLGAMYANGQGVPQDVSEAVHWYSLAADQGNEDARKLRDTLAEAISAGQIAAAQQDERDRRRVPQAALGSTVAATSATANAQQVSPITFEEVNDRFGVQSTLTDLQKDRQWDAFEGKCVEWTGELTSLSEGFFGGFSIQFKHLRTTFVSDVIVSAPSSAESQLLQWSEGQSYTYRGTLKRYGGAILPISIDWGCR